MKLPHYRKIGGIHWLAIGNWRISWCYRNPAIARLNALRKLPKARLLSLDEHGRPPLRAWTPDEHNTFLF